MNNKYNWSQIVTYIFEELFFSQQELGDRFHVSQQTVCNYKLNVRVPRADVKRKLLEILEDHNAEPMLFCKLSSNIINDLQKGEFKELLECYRKLSPMDCRNTDKKTVTRTYILNGVLKI